MKKFILPLIAIVMGIGFSAFTTKAPSKAKTVNLYYWYQVKSDGKIDFLVDPTLMDKTEALGTTPCDDQSSVTCLIGSTYDNLEEDDASPEVTVNRDNEIRKQFNP